MDSRHWVSGVEISRIATSSILGNISSGQPIFVGAIHTFYELPVTRADVEAVWRTYQDIPREIVEDFGFEFLRYFDQGRYETLVEVLAEVEFISKGEILDLYDFNELSYVNKVGNVAVFIIRYNHKSPYNLG